MDRSDIRIVYETGIHMKYHNPVYTIVIHTLLIFSHSKKIKINSDQYESCMVESIIFLQTNDRGLIHSKINIFNF